LANQIESFVIALANMDVAVMLRIERLRNPFFTGVAASDVLPGASTGFVDFAPVDLQQEIQSLMNPIAPFGSAIVGTVEDLQAQTRIKTQRARQAVETTFDLLSFDLLEGSFWMDARKAQGPERSFGAAPTAAWTAFRQHVPLRPSTAPQGAGAQSPPSAALTAAEFLKTTAASTFYRGRDVP
jgi:histidine ammonia-lyase